MSKVKEGRYMLDFKDFDLMIEDVKSTVKEKKNYANDIAIVGMAFKLPKADGIEEFWNNIRDGVDCITNISEERKNDVQNYFKYMGNNSDLKYCEMAYLDEIDKFDYKFFNLSPKEADLMDPNQRMFLEVAWQAIEDSGYGGNKLTGSRTGVYVGYSNPVIGSYMDVIKNVKPSLVTMGMIGNMPSMLPSRIGYFKDFRGPSSYVDTACSSSLVAIHNACQGIRNGDCDIAIAGSSELVIFPVENEQKMGIESNDNRTKAFDDDSDGTGVGEGVIALILKPLNKALQDKDNVYGIIKGTAINQDGNSIGITAPNSVAQEDVIIQSWKDAGIDPETISYIEAHGTATNLGDPIEIDGITRAFKKFTDKKQFCAISALKSNIGHLGAAAGIAGVVKAILSIKNSEIPPIVHLKMPNRKIDFESSPVYVNDILRKWDTQNVPKRCGVSSFGLSGTNCHLILEEAPRNEEIEKKENDYTYEVLTISAKSESAFKQLINKYIDMINEKNINLKDVCYTANTGRGHYKYRLAIIVKNKKDLLECLGNSCSNVEKKENVYVTKNLVQEEKEVEYIDEGEIRELSEAAKNIINRYKKDDKKNKKLINEICKLYIQGADIDWELLYRGEERRKVRVPVYPFDKTRCWIDIPQNMQLIKGGEESKEELKRTILKGRESKVFSELERVIADSWGKALGYKELNITDDFYELGGDSVVGIQLVNDISNKLSTTVNISDLLYTQTIEKMAEKLNDKLKEKQENKFLTITKAENMPYYPLSSAQKRMFITSLLEEVNTAYNIYGACTIEGDLDIQRFEDSLNKIINRHEAFRTSFEIINGEPVQIIHENVKVKISVNEVVESDIRKEFKRFVQPFDLKIAPLIRCKVLKVHSAKYVFMFDMHHIITDGYSMSIFIDEFMKIYNGETLSEIEIQYRDFSIWQNKFLESEDMKKQEQYWLNTFSGEIPMLNLPLDFPRPSIQKYDGDAIRVIVQSELTDKINKMAKKLNTTLYNVILTAYNILLMKYSGQNDIIIGSASTGRQNVECEKIIGMFVNMLAMRNYPNGNKCFSEFLAEVTNNSFKAFDNQGYQFEKLIDKLELERTFDKGRLFDTTFTLQNIRSKEFAFENMKVTNVEYEVNQSPYALSLIVFENKGELKLSFEYQTALFRKSTIEIFGKHFVEILIQVVENYNVKLSEIEFSNNYVTADTVQISKGDLSFNF
ncbi:condensation domain-containing protein [Bacillus cereus]|uniref:Uncharacterized protein n=1 Tax=Bacillus cereus HuA2-1 TaxID=1053201 RepID=J9CP05_BACCE|nr:condensation domain-containing protein [Bacillus cereus]EJV87815.1 hypothetical protein IG3_01302 [Bacillus cereus HuA2-1]